MKATGLCLRKIVQVFEQCAMCVQVRFCSRHVSEECDRHSVYLRLVSSSAFHVQTLFTGILGSGKITDKVSKLCAGRPRETSQTDTL